MNNLHLSDEAQADLAGIKAYISEELGNPSAARSVLRKITQDIRTLKRYALLGPKLSSICNIPSDYRFLVTGNYLTFYRVQGREIRVDRILNGRLNYLACLFSESIDQPPSVP